MNKILIASCLLLIGNANSNCVQLSDLNESQLWQIVRLKEFQRMFILVAGSLSIIGLILALLTWVLYRSLSIPSDIMLALMLSELVENSSLLASAIYSTVNQSSEVPSNFEYACLSIGIVLVFGNISALIYNVLFCVILSYSLTKTLKGTLFSQIRYHALAFFTIALSTIALNTTNNIGTGLSGVCGWKIVQRQQIGRFVVELIVCIICIVSMVRFRSHIPNNQYFKKEAVFGYYYYYMGIYTLIQIGVTVSYMVSSISCRTGSRYTESIVRISVAFSICFSIILSYVQIFIRLNHPILKIKLKKILCCKSDDISLEEEGLSLDEQTWLGGLLESIKGSQIISFITGILINFSEYEHRVPFKINPYHLKKNYIMSLNERITDLFLMNRVDYRDSVLVKQKLNRLQTLDYEVRVYAPEMFTKMIIDQMHTLSNSFNIQKNTPQVKKQSYTNGGKSGEFFYGTFDHRFVFKTVKEEEAQAYLDRIDDFHDYFKKNPESLIVKILGIYRFERKDIEQSPIYIILMANVSPVNRSYHERVYDIKGSEFNRSTLEEKKVDKYALSRTTLKDIDFTLLQGKIKVSQKESQLLRRIIKKDIQFLGRMGVMDYSLLIIKRKGPPQERQTLSEIKSAENADELYNIGIIDYLEEWTLKRKAERQFKSLITTKKVTATSPEEYSQRLALFVDQII